MSANTYADNSELTNRAMAAYWRTMSRKLGRDSGNINQPGAPDLVQVNGLWYVVLSNINGPLMVYRVRTVNGQEVLKGLKRWPKDLSEEFGWDHAEVISKFSRNS
jgi:hypothetical protein